MTQDPQNFQNQISTIDAGILALLDKRMKLTLEISEATKKGLIDINQDQEEELLKKLIEQNKNTVIPDEKLLELWGKIVEIPKDIVT